jgi:hypothetical protein
MSSNKEPVWVVMAATNNDPKNGWPIVPNLVGVYKTKKEAQKAMKEDVKDTLDAWDMEYDRDIFAKCGMDYDGEEIFWISKKACTVNDGRYHWCWNIFESSI